MKLAQKHAYAKHRSNMTNSKGILSKLNLINKSIKKNLLNKKS